MFRASRSIANFLFLFSLGFATPSDAETSKPVAEAGVTESTVKIGMVVGITGAVSDLGVEVKRGFEAYVNKVNAAGGVAGRKIEILFRDDAYKPENTVHLTRELIEKDKVFALAGYIGTPTTKALLPLIDKEQIPNLAPYTGGDFMRSPFNRNLFPGQPAYGDEVEKLVSHLVGDLGIKEIGIFTQDDEVGNTGRASLVRALDKRGLKIHGAGIYSAKNPADVTNALSALQATKPKAVILFSILKATVPFLKAAKDANFKPVFAAFSPVNSLKLIEALGRDVEGIYVTEGMPWPTDTSVPLIRNFQEDIKLTAEKAALPATVSGYMSAAILVAGMKKAGRNLTRESFRSALESLRNYDLGGPRLTYTPDYHEGLSNIYLTKIRNGKVVPIQKFEN
jgi:ABC-type branched-subunit amino acid transport system substrate-binding protein